jgi:hypothetical protein
VKGGWAVSKERKVIRREREREGRNGRVGMCYFVSRGGDRVLTLLLSWSQCGE